MSLPLTEVSSAMSCSGFGVAVKWIPPTSKVQTQAVWASTSLTQTMRSDFRHNSK
jgi:hypothetical protein